MQKLKLSFLACTLFTSLPAFAIIGGTRAEESDFSSHGLASSVVGIRMTFPSAPTIHAMCTGTLIGKRTVMTAAHCLRKMNPGSLTADFHALNIFQPTEADGPHLKVKDFRIYPGYSDSSQRFDLAVLLLDGIAPEAYTVATIADTEMPLPSNEHLLSLGYGLSDDRRNSPSSSRGAGTLKYTWFDTASAYYLEAGADSGTEGSLSLSGVETSVCEGDSGGPLMRISADGSRSVVGVPAVLYPGFSDPIKEKEFEDADASGQLEQFYAKYPDAPTCSGGRNVFTNIARFSGWIRKTVDDLESSSR